MTKDIEALVLNPNDTTGPTWKVVRGTDDGGWRRRRKRTVCSC